MPLTTKNMMDRQRVIFMILSLRLKIQIQELLALYNLLLSGFSQRSLVVASKGCLKPWWGGEWSGVWSSVWCGSMELCVTDGEYKLFIISL